MSDRADFCAFYYAQTGQAAVWIRDEKRFMFSNTELAWQSWQAAQGQAGTKARRSAVNPEAGDYANCVDDIPQAQAGDGVNQQLLEEGRFKQGAEGFRKELLAATTPFLRPHIEGVFAVFAHVHGFEPESNVGDQVRAEKAAIAAAQENNK
jgi:hypothetical protein